ncbi:hypothetical protein HY522_03140 [bacterium]|nr:hypothetical protein [bacterium]
MTVLAKEIARLVDSMPVEKARTVVDFARYLADRQEVEAWRKMTSDTKYSKKLGNAAEEARREIRAGKARPLTHSDF